MVMTTGTVIAKYPHLVVVTPRGTENIFVWLVTGPGPTGRKCLGAGERTPGGKWQTTWSGDGVEEDLGERESADAARDAIFARMRAN